MVKRRVLRKVIDDTTEVRCASGRGIVREEVRQDQQGVVIRYNLAFINHFLTSEDNGRVLGYDCSHGYHHRHRDGTTETFSFTSYEELYTRFFGEVEELRKEKP